MKLSFLIILVAGVAFASAEFSLAQAQNVSIIEDNADLDRSTEYMEESPRSLKIFCEEEEDCKPYQRCKRGRCVFRHKYQKILSQEHCTCPGEYIDPDDEPSSCRTRIGVVAVVANDGDEQNCENTLLKQRSAFFNPRRMDNFQVARVGSCSSHSLRTTMRDLQLNKNLNNKKVKTVFAVVGRRNFKTSCNNEMEDLGRKIEGSMRCRDIENLNDDESNIADNLVLLVKHGSQCNASRMVNKVKRMNRGLI